MVRGDAVDADGAFGGDELHEALGGRMRTRYSGALTTDRTSPTPSTWPWTMLAAHEGGGGGGVLEIDGGAGVEGAKCGFGEGFGDGIEGPEAVL